MSEAERIIARFGGIRPMAARLGIAVTTVQGWKERGTIPARRRADILSAAREAGVALEEGDFETAAAKPARSAKARKVPRRDRMTPPEAGPGRTGGKAEAAKTPPPIIDAKAKREKPPKVPKAPGRWRPLLQGVGLGALMAMLALGAVAAWWWQTRAVPMTPAPREVTTQATPAAKPASKPKTPTPAPQPPRASAKPQTPPPASRPPPAAAGNAELKARLDRLEARLAARAGQEKTAREAALAARRKDLDALRKDHAETVARLEKQNQALADRLKATAARLKALEKTAEQRPIASAPAASLVLAIGRMARTIERGRPFSGALDTVRALAGTGASWTAPLATLAPLAKDGVASLASLRARFDPLAGRVVRAAALPADAGWWRRAWDRTRALVTIRRVGADAEGEETDSVVARAEARIAAGDLAGAVEILASLKGAAATVAAEWLTAARARLAALDAAASLERLALERLAAERGIGE